MDIEGGGIGRKRLWMDASQPENSKIEKKKSKRVRESAAEMKATIRYDDFILDDDELFDVLQTCGPKERSGYKAHFDKDEKIKARHYNVAAASCLVRAAPGAFDACGCMNCGHCI